MICRPIWLPMLRAALVASAPTSCSVWVLGCFFAGVADGAAAASCPARALSFSYADSDRRGFRRCRRGRFLHDPRQLRRRQGRKGVRGGTIQARSTMAGTPFSSCIETRAPPPEFQDCSGRVEGGIRPEGLGGGPDGLLVPGVKARRACWTRLPSWPRTASGYRGDLGNEVHTDPLGAYQPHHLLDFFLQGLRGIVEEKMSLVEEKNELRFGGSPPREAARRAPTGAKRRNVA